MIPCSGPDLALAWDRWIAGRAMFPRARGRNDALETSLVACMQLGLADGIISSYLDGRPERVWCLCLTNTHKYIQYTDECGTTELQHETTDGGILGKILPG